MKMLKLLFFVFLLGSCNAPQAVYDYDEERNFQEYSTYAYFPDFRTGLNELDEKRIRNSLENALEQKGFSFSEDPEMYVNIYTEEFREQPQNNVGVGVGGGRGNVGVGVSGGIPLGGPDHYLQITFDFIDVEEDALIWQAVVESKFNPDASPEKRQAQFDQIVKKALEEYPPE